MGQITDIFFSVRMMKGFTLLEVLISLFILSILLLGLDAMQLSVLREAKSAYYFSVAMQQLNNMVERLQVVKCYSSQDQVAWNKQNQLVLPNGSGVILGVYPEIKLAIFWGGESERTCVKDKIGQAGCLYV